MRFPRASSTIFGLLWAFFQDPPTHWLLDHYFCSEYGEFNHLNIILTNTILIRYISKRSYGRKPNIDPFSPYHQTTPFEFLNRGPTSLVLVGYRLVMLRSLCACSTIFCFCLLSFPCSFCCSKLVLFHPVSCLFCQCLSSMKEGMGS